MDMGVPIRTLQSDMDNFEIFDPGAVASNFLHARYRRLQSAVV